MSRKLNDQLDAAVDAVVERVSAQVGFKELSDVLNRPGRWAKFKDVVWDEFEGMTVGEVRRIANRLDMEGR